MKHIKSIIKLKFKINKNDFLYLFFIKLFFLNIENICLLFFKVMSKIILSPYLQLKTKYKTIILHQAQMKNNYALKI